MGEPGARELLRHSLSRADGRTLHVYGPADPDREAVLGAISDPVDPPRLHLRLDALTNEWIAISPARNLRPQESGEHIGDGDCPFCPGGPEVPFSYELAVFDNRYPSLLLEPPGLPEELDDWRVRSQATPSYGHCEVVLYTQAHEGSVATLTPQQLVNLVAVWRDRSDALWADDRHAYVFTFENRGEAIGATLTHPHGQTYAFHEPPPRIVARDRAVTWHRTAHGECLMCTVVASSEADQQRVLTKNESFAVTVPFAPRWPYEVHIRARRHGLGRLGDLGRVEVVDLARALREVVHLYDALYQRPFSYMMAVHEAPREQPDWHLSFEFFPPDRSRDARKMPASVETATGFFINDTIPETSAAELRANAIPDVDWTSVTIPVVVAHEQAQALKPQDAPIEMQT